jgi:hypothetical protein
MSNIYAIMSYFAFFIALKLSKSVMECILTNLISNEKTKNKKLRRKIT